MILSNTYRSKKMRERFLLALQYLCLSSLSQLHDNGTKSEVKKSKFVYYSSQNSVLGRNLIELLRVDYTVVCLVNKYGHGRVG